MAITAFLTDSTLCIGCKACEVACKEWNHVAEDGLEWSGFSYDNTGSVGAQTWRHVKFVEQSPEPGFGGNAPEMNSWSFSSDVCKHCENADALRRVRRARLCARNSAEYMFNLISAMVAAIA